MRASLLRGRRATSESVNRAFSCLAAVLAVVAAGLLANPDARVAQRAAPARDWGYRVVKAYPHDPTAYTQGLIYRDGVLYESTGLNGRSTLRKVKLETGEVLQ